MQPSQAHTIFALGDNAITLDFGNVISEQTNEMVIRLFHWLKGQNIAGVEDIVPAYSSLTVFYNAAQIRQITKSPFQTLRSLLEAAIQNPPPEIGYSTRIIRIPVCYAPPYAPDLQHIAQTRGCTIEEVVKLHTEVTYRVYMLGFLPGFPYMGKVDDRIAFPRHAKPRRRVPAGAVGIAGSQTGIYSLDSPGGWQIIGSTPLTIFDRGKDQPVLLQPGDQVAFYPISEDEFTRYKSRPA